jgi:putative membrane protein (TIGR04086 family)
VNNKVINIKYCGSDDFMKFHPVISTILGIVTVSILLILIGPNFSESTFGALGVIILILGGFIATYFTEDKKIRYSIYGGIILGALLGAFLGITQYKNLTWIFEGFITFVPFMGIGGFIGKMTDNIERQNFKKHFDKGFNPILTIIIGFVISTFFYYFLVGITRMYNPNHPLTVFVIIALISNVFGGFIATFFAKEKKIQYGLYAGILIFLSTIAMQLIYGTFHAMYYSLINMLVYLLFASIGGFIGKMTDNIERQNFKNHFDKGFNPIITIVMGFIITIFFDNLLLWITGTYNSNPLGAASFIIGAISLVIGGFIATFFAKDKKIQYGVCAGIIVIILSIVINGTNNESYYIIISKIAGYLLSAGFGGYIGIIVDKHLKNT